MKINHQSNYVEKRMEAYPPIEEQLDMLFKDLAKLDIQSEWKDRIAEIKYRFPKPE